MKKIFVTERPTQIITALIISSHFQSNDDITILVANRFEDAPAIVKRFQTYQININFQLTQTYEEAIKIAELALPGHLFIHWDVGYRTQSILQRLRRKNTYHTISVFEEGIGTYRQDIYPIIKKMLFTGLCLPTSIGQSKHINDIYVYNKEKYLIHARLPANHIHQIQPSLTQYISKNEIDLLHVFASENLIKPLKTSGERSCKVYLSSWHINKKTLENAFQGSGFKIIKLHPHCEPQQFESDILTAPNSLPAELLVISLSNIFDSIEIYHHNSSVQLYINLDNVKFINIEQ